DRRDLWSWAYHLLPHLEEESTHDNPSYFAVIRRPIRVYYCPARRQPTLYNDEAKIDYAGNAGTDIHGRNGVIQQTGYGVCRVSDVHDGTAHTICIAEKQMNEAAFGRSADDSTPYVTAGWNGNMAVYRFGLEAPTPDVNVVSCSTAPPSERFGS